MWPRSAGLGTHLRDQLIDWVAAIHPDASVSKGVLSTVDADPENLERRTRFYKGANFNLVLSDDGSGSFWADRLGDLKRSTPDSRVVEIKSDEIRTTLKRMGELQEAKVTISHLENRCRQMETEIRVAHRRAWLSALLVVAMLVGLYVATESGRRDWHPL